MSDMAWQCEYCGETPQHRCGQPSPRDRQVGGNHYVSKSVQPWAALESWLKADGYEAYLRGNVVKYMVRYRDENGVEDLERARHYLDELIRHLERPA